MTTQVLKASVITFRLIEIIHVSTYVFFEYNSCQIQKNISMSTQNQEERRTN